MALQQLADWCLGHRATPLSCHSAEALRQALGAALHSHSGSLGEPETSLELALLLGLLPQVTLGAVAAALGGGGGAGCRRLTTSPSCTALHAQLQLQDDADTGAPLALARAIE